jgi:hypothetical protein
MPEFKPTDIYVGVVELFSVLLPGALLEAAIVRAVYPDIGNPFAPLLVTPETQWVAFGIAAYVLGAFVFPLASELDERAYDPYRNLLWPKANDHAYQLATDLRRGFFDQPPAEDGDRPMNTFAWSKSVLALRAPTAFAEVQRYEAESKFFRSLVVVLPAVAAFLVKAWWRSHPGLNWIAVPLLLAAAFLSFHRYAERRHKSTEWAYRYTVTMLCADAPQATAAPPLSAEPPVRRRRA